MRKAVFALLATIMCCMAATGVRAEESDAADRFVLGPGDVLEISVWGDNTLLKKVLVRPDGNISFPLIGDVQAKGLTVDALRKQVQTKIVEFLPDSPVTVLLDQLNSTAIFVLGKVNRPGSYIMQGPTSVAQALAMAGGTTPYADDGNILVVRREGTKQVTFPFSYSKLSAGKDLDKNIILKPRDTIVVP